MSVFNSSLKNMSAEGLAALIEIAENGESGDSGFSWSCLSMSPYNALTEEVYNGRNGTRLWLDSRKVRKEDILSGRHDTDPRYMTFEQIAEYGKKHNVHCGLKKGARGVSIITPGQMSLRLSAEEVERAKKTYAAGKVFSVLRPHNAQNVRMNISPKHIFSRTCVKDGGEVWRVLSGFQPTKVFSCRDMYGIPPLDGIRKDFSVHSSVKDLFAGIDVSLVVSVSVNDVVFNSLQKTVFIPSEPRFHEKGAFERTALHEWYHATGDLMGRESLNPGMKAREEAEAEIFSLLMGDALGIPGNSRRADSARYIANWATFAGKETGQMVWDCLENVRKSFALAENILSPEPAEENTPTP